MNRLSGLVWTACVATRACGRDAPPALGEVLVVVDTDLPAQLAGRLRVDLYSEAGTWYESRDIGRPQAADWPASFSVFAPDGAPPIRVLVRVRVYPEGLVRDYRGERWADASTPPKEGATASDVAPRLVRDGADATPPIEPLPTATIDRLLIVRLEQGVRGRVRVTARGACAGRMARLGDEPPHQTPNVAEARSCIEGEDELMPAREMPLEDDMSIPTVSTALGTFTRTPEDECAPDASDARVACVPGGVFLFGDAATNGLGEGLSVPQRIVRQSRFWLDRYEVTVGALRRAAAKGLTFGTINVGAHEGELGARPPSHRNVIDQWCTWTAAPRGREGLPINCIDWETARAYCQSVGGDLPTETQWEYVASAAARPFKTDYPWGNETATCERAVLGNLSVVGDAEAECFGRGRGPAPPGASAGDVTSLGIYDLAGNVAELVRDAHHSLDAPCWLAAPVSNPVCVEERKPQPIHSLRGGSFLSDPAFANGNIRNDDATFGLRAAFGFRCAYPKPPGRP